MSTPHDYENGSSTVLDDNNDAAQDPRIDITEGAGILSRTEDPAQTKHSFFTRLYTGTGAFDIIGKRKRWYAFSGLVILICIGSFIFHGFTLGIDFQGGTKLSIPLGSEQASVQEITDIFKSSVGFGPEKVQIVGSGQGHTAEVESQRLDNEQVGLAKDAFVTRYHPSVEGIENAADAIGDSSVSSSWGGTITKRAIVALCIFLSLVTVYIAFRFGKDFDMAIAALVSLFFDVGVTAGVYSIVGFEVTPATVIGLLTILGFSIYDTVIVFDKVQENTRGFKNSTEHTYAELTNLAVNQTLMRSINTTIISVLPIISLMVVAVWMLGVGTLQDLALIQLVGVIVGTYSSVFLASPLLVTFKEYRKHINEHNAKVTRGRAIKR